LFIFSPAAHTLYVVRQFGLILHATDCFAILVASTESYDFDPTTSPQKSGKTRAKKSKIAALIAGQI
jgi:uncharacterized protein (DUF362 family)